MTAEDIYRELREIGGDAFSHVTISGGNPALLKQLDALILLLKEHGVRAALETQGTVYQDWFTMINDLTISPKPPSSGMTTDFAKLDHIVSSLDAAERLNAVSLKVVILMMKICNLRKPCTSGIRIFHFTFRSETITSIRQMISH